jgi:hypothetical protein
MKTVLAVAVLLVFSFEVSAITLTVSGGGFDGIVGAKQFRDGSYDVSVGAASIDTDHGAVSINARHITRTAVDGSGTIERGLMEVSVLGTPVGLRGAYDGHISVPDQNGVQTFVLCVNFPGTIQKITGTATFVDATPDFSRMKESTQFAIGPPTPRDRARYLPGTGGASHLRGAGASLPEGRRG